MTEKCSSGTKISLKNNRQDVFIILSTTIDNTLFQHTVTKYINNLFLVLSFSKTGKCHAH